MKATKLGGRANSGNKNVRLGVAQVKGKVSNHDTARRIRP